jgi:hypothetical protein
MRRMSMLLTLGLVVLGALPAHAAVNWLRRDMVVELRQITAESEARETEDGRDVPGGYSVATVTTDDRMATHRVRVQNGEKAQIRFIQSQPIQWVQAASSQSTTLAVGEASATQNTGAVSQEHGAVETGYTLVLTPRWAGGTKPVQAVLDLQTTAVDAGTVGDASSSTRSQLSTTVTVPLRQWVTVATSGTSSNSSASRTYRSAGATGGLQLIQIRISPQ